MNIKSDGSTTGTMSLNMDMKPMLAMYGVTTEQYTALDAATKAQMDVAFKAQICANASTSMNLTNVKCDVKDAVLTVSGDVKGDKLNSTQFKVNSGLFETEYVFAPPADSFNNGMTAEQLQNFSSQAAGSKATLYVSMPGTISEATNGKIVNGVAVFDLVDLVMKGKAPAVKSKELNLPVIGGIVVVVLIVLVGAYMMMNKQPAKKK